MSTFRFMFVVLCLTLEMYPLKVRADSKPTNNELVSVMYSSHQMQIETLREHQRLELEELRKKLSASEDTIIEMKSQQNLQALKIENQSTFFNQRIDDSINNVGQDVDRFGLLLTIFGLILTVVLALVSYLGFFTVITRTKAEARKWFEDNSNSLVEEISQLNQQVNSVKKSLAERLMDVEEHADKTKELITTSADRIREFTRKIDVSVDNITSDSNATTVILNTQSSDSLRNKPFSQYSFTDWVILGNNSFENDDYESAAYYFLKAWNDDSMDRVRRVNALFNRGVSQSKLKQSAQEIQTYDTLIAYVGDDKSPILRERVAKVMFYKGITQGQLDQSEQAILTYDALIAYVGDDKSTTLRELVAKAMINKGVRQGKLGQSDQEIQTYDTLIEYAGDDRSPELRERVAKAILYKGITQGLLSQSEKAIQTYDTLIEYVGDDKSPELQDMVAKAMLNKGVRQNKLNQTAQEIQTYDTLIEYVGEDKAPVLRKRVAKAMLYKGMAQNQLNQSQEANKTYDALIAYVGDDKSPELRELAEKALSLKTQ